MKNAVHLVTNEINRLVYALYELPDDEMEIVELPAVEEVTAPQGTSCWTIAATSLHSRCRNPWPGRRALVPAGAMVKGFVLLGR